MPHGGHIYASTSYMENATMCEYPQSDHALPHYKYVIRCCAKFPSVNLPGQEIDYQYTDTSPSISFHINHQISRCSIHGRFPLTDKTSVASVNMILF